MSRLLVRVKKQMTQRKVVEEPQGHLTRALSLFDLTALGVGSTLGLGVYVLTGAVAYNIAGPGVVFSFLLAALASLFAGLCYSEFASRVPHAGSAYIYSYVTMGEFVGFTIGWSLVLEYIVGTASVARGLTSYVDALLNHSISTALEEVMPVHSKYLSEYLDVVAFLLITLLTIVMAIGVRESSLLNNILTMLNILTILIVVGAGITKVNVDNWNVPASEVPDDLGAGGFLPYGLNSIFVGAANCFYGFIGFDCIATTGEEAINPIRDIPVAILLSLTIITVAYLSMSTVLTMMMPYYKINALAPLSYAFEYTNMIAVKWCVTIGAAFALCTSLLGAMFPLPRILYAMAMDGLMFKRFACINSWTHTPLIATVCSGLFAASIAMMIDLHQLIELGTIGPLLAYTIVSVGVLLLHYEGEDVQEMNEEMHITYLMLLRQLYNGPRYRQSNAFTESFSKFLLALFTLLCLAFCLFSRVASMNQLYEQGILIALAILVVICMFFMAMQPQAANYPSFKVPCVPFIPCITIFVNMYLMFQLMVFTGVGYFIWMFFGYIIYFAHMLANFSDLVYTIIYCKTRLYWFRFLEPG